MPPLESCDDFDFSSKTRNGNSIFRETWYEGLSSSVLAIHKTRYRFSFGVDALFKKKSMFLNDPGGGSVS